MRIEEHVTNADLTHWHDCTELHEVRRHSPGFPGTPLAWKPCSTSAILEMWNVWHLHPGNLSWILQNNALELVFSFPICRRLGHLCLRREKNMTKTPPVKNMALMSELKFAWLRHGFFEAQWMQKTPVPTSSRQPKKIQNKETPKDGCSLSWIMPFSVKICINANPHHPSLTKKKLQDSFSTLDIPCFHPNNNILWVFPKIMVPPCTLESSILIGFSIIFTIHFGVPLFLETSI